MFCVLKCWKSQNNSNMYHSNSKQIIWVLRQMTSPFLKSQFHFQRKYCLLSGPNDVQFHFPNSWILTLQQRCRTTMMKMVIPPTNQLLTHQFCRLITFKLEGSIVIQLRVVVVLVFPPHPHIHPLVSRNVIKWMTKTWGCRIVAQKIRRPTEMTRNQLERWECKRRACFH